MAKLFKRGRVWYAWVPKRKGRGGTHKVSTQCTDKRAAENVRAQIEREAIDPAFAAANRATTQKLVDDYYVSREMVGRAEGSKKHVFQKSRHLVRLLPTLAADITHAVVQEYVRTRLGEWAVAPTVDEKDVVVHPGRKVRRTTIKKELRVLKATLKLARKNGLFLAHPDEVIPDLEDDHEPGKRFLTPWEFVGLACVLPARRMAVVAFAAATGCDPGKTLWRARRDDVSDDLYTVQIHGKKRRTRERPSYVPLPEQRALLAWALKHADGKNGLLFTPWHNMRRDLHIAARKLRIPGFSATDLRRTYGTWLRQARVEPHLIGAAMGHRDSRMVERYYGKLPADDLGRLLRDRVPQVTPEQTGLLMGCGSDETALSGARGANGAASQNGPNPAEIARLSEVRRGRIELPTRGFSVRCSTD